MPQTIKHMYYIKKQIINLIKQLDDYHSDNNIDIDSLNLSEELKNILKDENILTLENLKNIELISFAKKYSKFIKPAIILKELKPYYYKSK